MSIDFSGDMWFSWLLQCYSQNPESWNGYRRKGLDFQTLLCLDMTADCIVFSLEVSQLVLQLVDVTGIWTST
jgi:hypothetical protein